MSESRQGVIQTRFQILDFGLRPVGPTPRRDFGLIKNLRGFAPSREALLLFIGLRSIRNDYPRIAEYGNRL